MSEPTDREMTLSVLESLVATGIPVSAKLRNEFTRKLGELSEPERARLRAAVLVRNERDERDRLKRTSCATL